MFSGRDLKEFGTDINRVDENPIGYVDIVDSKNKHLKLEKGNFKKYYPLTSSECRNIFIIRNSDLTITSEDRFYDRIGDSLMGLQTETFSIIKDKLRDIGKITPSNNFKNDKTESLKDRLNDAQTILDNICALNEDMEEENLDKLETESIDLRANLEETNNKISLLEEANRRETYEKSSNALSKLGEAFKDLSKFKSFNKEDAQTWHDAQKEIDIHTKTKGALQKELVDNNETLRQGNEKLNQINQACKELTNIKQKIDRELDPQIIEYRNKRSRIVQQESTSKFFTVLSAFSGIMLLLTIAGLIIFPSTLFYLLAGIGGILFASSTAIKLRYLSNKAKLDDLFDRIKLLAATYNLHRNIEGILLKTQQLDQQYENTSKELRKIEITTQTIENKINKTQRT